MYVPGEKETDHRNQLINIEQKRVADLKMLRVSLMDDLGRMERLSSVRDSAHEMSTSSYFHMSPDDARAQEVADKRDRRRILLATYDEATAAIEERTARAIEDENAEWDAYLNRLRYGV
jgi:hypothetical protein